jgi:hypothetical protein
MMVVRVKILGEVEIWCVNIGFYVVLVLGMKTGLTSTTSEGSMVSLVISRGNLARQEDLSISGNGHPS